MKKKLIFFDIDGTLKPIEKKIPNSTIKAIIQLKKNGHIPIICSGRSLCSITHDYDILNLDCAGYICSAGNHVIYNHKDIYKNNLSEKQINTLIDIFRNCNTPYMLEGVQSLYYETRFEADCVSIWKQVLGDVPMKHYESYCDEIQKCMVTHGERLKELNQDSILEEFMDLLWYDSPIGVVEIIPKENSKATGIQKLMKYLNIDIDDTYAFGDGPNDMEMIDFVSHGVAMGNASTNLKRHAEYITNDCDKDGIINALSHYHLI